MIPQATPHSEAQRLFSSRRADRVDYVISTYEVVVVGQGPVLLLRVGGAFCPTGAAR